MKLKHIDVPFEIKAVNEDGTFKGYGSVFGVLDSYREIVLPGAFTKSIAVRQPKMLWQHRSAEPIGVYDVVKEDNIGLYLEGRLALKTQRGAEAYELMKMGAVGGLSIGFVTREDSYDKVENVRKLAEVDLWEVSPVTFPANMAAGITDVKNMLEAGELPNLKDFEAFLREAGFSKTQATAIAGKGLAHLLRGEPVDEKAMEELASEARRLLCIS